MTQLELKLEYLGYKNGIEGLNIGNNYDMLLNLRNTLHDSDSFDIPKIDIKTVKEDAIKFYEKYFAIHNVKLLMKETFISISKDLNSNDKILEAYRKYSNLSREISPFDIPIELVRGHSMVGIVEKTIMLIPIDFIPNDLEAFVPFSNILLGDQLTGLSSSTYIHEISHTQQESNLGYAESYLNKEVISIFLEKLSAMELDPSGKILKLSELKRFIHMCDMIRNLKMNGTYLNLTESEKLENYCYIQSTLYAMKLFDMYLKENKQKNRDKYIADIQAVFDRKKTVEEIIKIRNITLNNAKDMSLIKRHI